MMIYSIFSNPSFINILIIALLIFLILFLWRKIMILEGNMFILDKRVNLLKKDNRDSAINRSKLNANANMQEVFGGDNVCSTSACCFMPMQEAPVNKIEEITIMTSVINNNEKNLDDDVEISFPKEPVNPVPSIADVANVQDPTPDEIISMAEGENVENQDTMSVASEITFNTDAKYSQKKLSKMSIDKLKDICTSLNINVEGTKAQLITRILENK